MICAFQWDLARQAERLSWLLRQLPRYADWGYREVYLHLEDAVEYPGLPGVARPGAYRYRDLERLVRAAERVGIGVVPIVNLLGHTQYLIKVPELRELNERLDAEGRPMDKGQICPLHPRTLEVADRLLGDMAPFCTAGKVHVGLDESYHLGRHPLSRAEVEEVGLAGHFGRYVQRLHALCVARGLRMGMWADMLALLPEAIGWVPAGVAAYDWYYYPFRRRPAVELHNFREYDLVPALRAQGVEYWGCPMSGPFRHEPLPTFGDRIGNLRAWWERCRRVNAAGFLVTQWETSRVSAPVVQAVDAAAASLWLEVGRAGSSRAPRARRLAPQAMLAGGFGRAFGAGRAQAARMAGAAWAADRYPFAGYYRWELGDDWDFGARGDAAERAKEEAWFARLERKVKGLPEPFAASIRWRSYLARRDAFVTRWAGAGQAEREKLAGQAKALRRRMVKARVDAQTMWAASRSGPSPQVALARADGKRLRKAERELSPGVFFRCLVHNFAPAMQQVVIELPADELGPRAEAGWTEAVVLRGRFTMEFTSVGAKRRASALVRALAARLPEPIPSQLRLAVRGVGEVRISRCEILRDGRARRVGPKSPVRLGAPAPEAGFPEVDFERSLGASCLIALVER